VFGFLLSIRFGIFESAHCYVGRNTGDMIEVYKMYTCKCNTSRPTTVYPSVNINSNLSNCVYIVINFIYVNTVYAFTMPICHQRHGSAPQLWHFRGRPSLTFYANLTDDLALFFQTVSKRLHWAVQQFQHINFVKCPRNCCDGSTIIWWFLVVGGGGKMFGIDTKAEVIVVHWGTKKYKLNYDY